MKTLICDVDNTVADQMRRLKKYFNRQSGTLDEKLAYSAKAIAKDIPIEGSAEGIRHFKRIGYRVIWLTARKRELRKATYHWLINHDFPVDKLILVNKLRDKIEVIRKMRPDLIIDDCQYNMEHLKPLLASEFIADIHNMGFSLVVFQNNWADITLRYSEKPI